MNDNFPIEYKIGSTLCDVLYYGTSLFIIFASEKSASYVPVIGHLAGIYLSENFLNLFKKRWDENNCDEFYDIYFTIKTRYIINLLKYYKPVLF